MVHIVVQALEGMHNARSGSSGYYLSLANWVDRSTIDCSINVTFMPRVEAKGFVVVCIRVCGKSKYNPLSPQTRFVLLYGASEEHQGQVLWIGLRW